MSTRSKLLLSLSQVETVASKRKPLAEVNNNSSHCKLNKRRLFSSADKSEKAKVESPLNSNSEVIDVCLPVIDEIIEVSKGWKVIVDNNSESSVASAPETSPICDSAHTPTSQDHLKTKFTTPESNTSALGAKPTPPLETQDSQAETLVQTIFSTPLTSLIGTTSTPIDRDETNTSFDLSNPTSTNQLNSVQEKLKIPPLNSSLLLTDAHKQTNESQAEVTPVTLHTDQSPDEEKHPLVKFLSSIGDGQAILQCYKAHSKLTDKKRNELADLLIRKEFGDNPNKQILASDFYRITDQIKQVFPLERTDTYYVPSFADKNRKTLPSGKLYNKYFNICKKYKNDGIRRKRGYRKEETVDSFNYNLAEVSDEEHQACIEWLYSYITPWDLVINKWKLTAHRRLHSFETLDLDINEYVQAFPCLSKTSQVADLIEIDFSVKYGRQRHCLFNAWTHLKKSLITFAQDKIKYDQSFKNHVTKLGLDLESECEIASSVVAVYVFLLLVPTATLSGKRKRKAAENQSDDTVVNTKVWRPSRDEVVKSFIIQVPSSSSMEDDLAARISHCVNANLKCQAFIILVGENPFSYIVYFNRKRFFVEDVQSAVDLCFKILMVFGAEYPSECISAWTFLQKFIYNITTPYDINMPSLATFAADLGLL